MLRLLAVLLTSAVALGNRHLYKNDIRARQIEAGKRFHVSPRQSAGTLEPKNITFSNPRASGQPASYSLQL